MCTEVSPSMILTRETKRAPINNREFFNALFCLKLFLYFTWVFQYISCMVMCPCEGYGWDRVMKSDSFDLE